MPSADDTGAGRLATAADDYDPVRLDARAERLNRAAALALAEARRGMPDVQRLVVEACAAAAQFRRLAADVRTLERFLTDCGWMAEAEAEAPDQSLAG
jgi:hypothetical protein